SLPSKRLHLRLPAPVVVLPGLGGRRGLLVARSNDMDRLLLGGELGSLGVRGLAFRTVLVALLGTLPVIEVFAVAVALFGIVHGSRLRAENLARSGPVIGKGIL